MFKGQVVTINNINRLNICLSAEHSVIYQFDVEAIHSYQHAKGSSKYNSKP